jgi:hypothetical protein
MVHSWLFETDQVRRSEQLITREKLTVKLIPRHAYTQAMGFEEPDPADVFEPLANTTRIEILQALAEAYSTSPTEPWIAYSDLKERVGSETTAISTITSDSYQGLSRTSKRDTH